jgi:hypothetical protein
MNRTTPAQLYALVAGGALLILGILDFFYSADFGSPGRVAELFGAIDVNGWLGALHVATGAAGLLAVGYGGRGYAGAVGAGYVLLAAWGFAVGAHGDILGLVPVDTAGDALHAVVGATGLAVYAATPRR